jgi:hypothetical protein
VCDILKKKGEWKDTHTIVPTSHNRKNTFLVFTQGICILSQSSQQMISPLSLGAIVRRRLVTFSYFLLLRRIRCDRHGTASVMCVCMKIRCIRERCYFVPRKHGEQRGLSLLRHPLNSSLNLFEISKYSESVKNCRASKAYVCDDGVCVCVYLIKERERESRLKSLDFFHTETLEINFSLYICVYYSHTYIIHHHHSSSYNIMVARLPISYRVHHLSCTLRFLISRFQRFCKKFREGEAHNLTETFLLLKKKEKCRSVKLFD